MLTPTRAPQPYTPPPPPPARRPPARSRTDGWRRARRVAVVAALICLVPALVSFASAMAQRSNSSFLINAVEWMRDNGARGLVNSVENFYYSLNAPAKGGPALRALPRQSGAYHATSPAVHVVVHYYRPAPIRPIIHPALPGEGVWHATFADGGARPPVLITSFRPNPSYPQLVAGVAWIDHTRTSTWLYPGVREPHLSLPARGPERVPIDQRYKLLATFNSAFKLADSGGGFASGGHTYAALQDGIATIVRYRGGNVDVLKWTGGPHAGPDVVYARQNLPLIVSGAKPNPNLSDGPEWGATLGNAVQVWRSAVGVDRYGNLIYGAANYQTVRSLAAIMIRAGAVRAMELDINTYWTSFISYRFPGAHGPANLLSSMDRSPLRYLSPDDRDFFAVYVR
jgi:hypothetical protein